MKKYTLALLISLFVISMAFVAVSCANVSMHNYSSKWSSDEDNHFHRCTDTGCQARSDEAAHDWVLIPDKVTRAPTCGVPGYGQFKCSVCESTIDMPIPPTEEHEWEDVPDEGLEPTCGQDGFKIRKCRNCGTREVVTIPATGDHQFGSEYEDADPDSGIGGGHYTVCTVCGLRSEIEPHIPGAPQELIPVDEKSLTDGKTVTFCEKCNHIIQEVNEEPPGVPHSFEISMRKGNKALKVEPTVDSGFKVTISLDNDGKYYFEFINVKDKNGDPIEWTTLPSAITVRCTLKGGINGDTVLDFQTTPQFNFYNGYFFVFTTNFNRGKYIQIDLLTGENETQKVRASCLLFFTIADQPVFA